MHFAELFSFCPVCGSNNFILNNEKSKRCEDCDFVLYVNPSAAVAAFIINSANELLVCKRGKNPEKGTLDLPGGFVDGNETVEQAVIREIKEELNGEVAEVKYLFSLPNEYLYSGWSIPTIDIFFAIELNDYSALNSGDDVESYTYISIKDLNPELFGLKSIKKAITIYKKNSGIE